MIFSDKEDMMKGYIQVYTGDGKGKTTAAIGLAIPRHRCGEKGMHHPVHEISGLLGAESAPKP